MFGGRSWVDRNAAEELVQRAAWRLVRSAQDRIGVGRGAEKLLHATKALEAEFQGISNAEDYIRAAYIHFRTENPGETPA